MSDNNCIQYINCHCYMTIQSLQIKARMFSRISLISLIMFPVIWSQVWEVQYSSMMKCALKGSNTHLSGSYKHPNLLTVIKTFWTVNPVKGEENINLMDHPDYKGRVQYSPEKEQTCVLSLSNVTHKDEGVYCLRILTDVEKERFLGFPGIELKVTELRVEIPEEAVEGKSSVLFCKTTCHLSDKTNFTWFKNNKRLSESNVLDQLLLPSVSTDDTGNYSCAVTDHKHLSSPAVTLSVRYPPKSVSVSISPSEIVEGDSVTLICSSDSNPPALNFSWFKKGMFVGSGRIYNISNIRSDHSGEYKCRSGNKYGVTDSDNVMMNVKYAPRDVVVTLNSSAEIVEGDSVTLICSSDSNPPALNFSWFKENQSSAVGSGQSFIISSFNSRHSGRYYCETQNQHGSQRSASVSVKESSSSLIMFTMGISAAVVLTSAILMVFIRDLIRRKRATPSEEENPGGSGHNKTLESPEDTYMSLEPKSRCSEYDTLDNMKRSCENTDHPEDSIYDNF